MEIFKISRGKNKNREQERGGWKKEGREKEERVPQSRQTVAWSLRSHVGTTLGGRTQGRKGRVTTGDSPRPSPRPSPSAQLPASPGWPSALSWSQHRSVTSYQSHGFSKGKVTTPEHFTVTKESAFTQADSTCGRSRVAQ